MPCDSLLSRYILNTVSWECVYVDGISHCCMVSHRRLHWSLSTPSSNTGELGCSQFLLWWTSCSALLIICLPLHLNECFSRNILINFLNASVRRRPLSQHRHIQNEVIIWSYAWPLLLSDCRSPVTPKGNPGSLCLIPWRDFTSMFRCQPPFCCSRNFHFSCIDFEGDGIDNLSRELATSRCFILLPLQEASGL